MALIAWYPLNGDTKDYSGNGNHLLNGNFNGNLQETDNGKIGRAWERPVAQNGADYFRTTNKIYLSADFTMACWAKVSECDMGTANGLFTNHSHADNSGAGITVRTISNSEFRSSCSTGTGSSRTFHTYSGTSNIKDRWAHLVVMFEKETNRLTLWVDGVMEHERTYEMYTIEDHLGIFLWSTSHTGSSRYRPAAIINDARVYDHALSEKEIKEIAKAKVLHYTFNDFQEPTENIWVGNLTVYNNLGIPNTLEKTGATFMGAEVLRLTMTPNTESQLNSIKTNLWNHGVRGSSNLYKASTEYTSSIYWKAVNKDDIEVNGLASNIGGWVNGGNHAEEGMFRCLSHRTGNVTEDKTGGLFWSFKSPSAVIGEPIIIDWAAPQIEEKPHATPFTPNTRPGTVLDSSGHGNHAELALTTTPRWTEDSKVGSGAYEFDGNSKFINTFFSPKYSTGDSFSYCAWFRTISSSAGRLMEFRNDFVTGNPIITLLPNSPSVGGLAFLTRGNNGVRRDVNFYGSLNDGNWHHVAGVLVGNGHTKLYIDGVEVGTNSSGVDANINLSDITLPIGARNLGGAIDEYFDGDIDDVRVYHTALTASDIKELYQSRASLDSGGNFQSNVFHETKTKPLLMNYTVWEDGQTGSIGNFGQYSSRNSRILAPDPWGKIVPVWRGLSVDGSTAGAGIYHNPVPIDNTKMYRMSWWEKRVTNSTATYARYYAGLNGYGSVNGVLTRSGGTNNTNPYFHLAHNLPSYPRLPVDEWTLVVGHVWPVGSGTGGDHKDSGIYTLKEGKITDLYYRDYVWREETETARSRTLMIYIPDAGGVEHHTAYPRMDICDGTEPSIQDLLDGFDSRNFEYYKTMNGTDPFNMKITEKQILSSEYSETGPINGLIAWYPLNGDTEDYTENRNNGVNSGAAPTSSPTGGGYKTDGLESYIKIEGTPAGISPVTMGCWFKPVGGSGYLLNQFQSTGTSWALLYNGGGVRIFNDSSGVSNQSYTAHPAPYGEWVHVMAVHNQEGYSLYVNGELASGPEGKDDGDGPASIGGNLFVGQRGNETNFLNMEVSDIRIYNRALSPEEISILYKITDQRSKEKMLQSSDGTVYVQGEFREI